MQSVLSDRVLNLVAYEDRNRLRPTFEGNDIGSSGKQ